MRTPNLGVSTPSPIIINTRVLRSTAFNRNRFNNNRTNWLVDYNAKIPHHSLELRSPIQYPIHQ